MHGCITAVPLMSCCCHQGALHWLRRLQWLGTCAVASHTPSKRVDGVSSLCLSARRQGIPHHSAGDHNTWRDAAIIGTHLVDAVAIAVLRCTGMALQKSQWRARQVAMEAQAA